MPSLQIEQFGDLVELTIDKYIKTDYVNLISDLTDHPAAKQLIKKSRMGHQSGTQIDFKVRLSTGESYEQIDPTTPDAVEMSDDFESAAIPFRKRKVSYTFLQEQVDFQAGPEKIIDLVKAKEDGADFDFLDGIENEFWSFPLATNTRNFYSLWYWCGKNSSTGFNGGTPTGYSNVAGLSPTTYSRWNNYTAQYTNVTLDDLIRKARTMAVSTDFKPPINVSDLGDTGSSRAYYTNLSVVQTFEDVADSRNDNLGADVAKMDGMATFRRAPVVYIPKLDGDTTNPFIQMNWNVFKIIVKNGWWNKRTVVAPYPGQRNQVAVFKDTYMNMACFNRRLLGVIATGTTYPLSV